MDLFNKFGLLICLIEALLHGTTAIRKGVFWHITDIHMDSNYSIIGDPKSLCHASTTGKNQVNGPYGNMFCDSPKKLVALTIKEMRRIEPYPDFIIWTGDNLPHMRVEWDAIYREMRQISISLRTSFPPRVKILPVIGNHDLFPPNIANPDGSTSIYQGFLEKGGWDALLPTSTRETFLKGGYYSYKVQYGLRIIGLNMILWYDINSVVTNMTDPGDQFSWLISELKDAKQHGDKVYIIGHASAGFYNRAREGTVADPILHLKFQQRYMDIIESFSEVIKCQMFGHIHHDMFQLYSYKDGKAAGSSLLAPSVTPWKSSGRHADLSLAVNPSVRLMTYNAENYDLLDFHQYYLNLTKANKEAMKLHQTPSYELLYSFAKTYNVPDLTTKSLVLVLQDLASNDDTFDTFFKYLTASKVQQSCNKSCRQTQLCSMGYTKKDDYMNCMRH